MSSRHRSTDGNGEDDSYGIGKTDTKQGCDKRNVRVVEWVKNK